MSLVGYSVDVYGNYMWPNVRFMNYIDENSLGVTLNKKWPNREFDHTGSNYIHESAETKTAFFVWEEDMGAYILSTSHGEIGVTVAARTLEVANRIMEHVESIAPKYEETDIDKVSVSFWSLGDNGPTSVTRSLVVPSWDDIRVNYSQKVTGELDRYINTEWRPTKGGQLVLWYGEPGTGKTTALRALAREWREWCDVHYIADPERFFGTNANYMMNVLVNGESLAEDNRWRLLLLEDCGELIAADAKQTSGQGLSRLLNVVDGLIGQGLRFLVLITTNEDIKKLNDAIVRPGRCLSQIEFDKLDTPEVLNWVTAHQLDRNNFPSRATLAELYAVKDNFSNQKIKKTVGFA